MVRLEDTELIEQFETGDRGSRFKRAADYILHHEMLKPLARFARSIEERYIDWRLNIETKLDVDRYHPSGKMLYEDAVFYSALRYARYRHIEQLLELTSEDVVYDVGCGKGRLLCLIAQRPVKKVIGIELDEELSNIATRNAARLNGKLSPIKIVCADACDASLDDGTLYIFYNPFGPETMKHVLGRIRNTHIENPRDIRIMYFNPEHEGVFSDSGWLIKSYEHFSSGWRDMSLWSSDGFSTQSQNGPSVESRFLDPSEPHDQSSKSNL